MGSYTFLSNFFSGIFGFWTRSWRSWTIFFKKKNGNGRKDNRRARRGAAKGQLWRNCAGRNCEPWSRQSDCQGEISCKSSVQLFPPIILSASLSVFFLLSLKLLLSAFTYPWRAQYQPLFADAPFDNQDMDAYMDYTVSFFKVDDVSFSIHHGIILPSSEFNIYNIHNRPYRVRCIVAMLATSTVYYHSTWSATAWCGSYHFPLKNRDATPPSAVTVWKEDWTRRRGFPHYSVGRQLSFCSHEAESEDGRHVWA